MFNIESFDIKLDTDVIGRNFVYSEELDSTNSVLLDKENKFKVNGTVVLAEKQLRGKGRKDRVWYSAKGLNLTFSILLTDKRYFKRNFSLINLAISLSVATAIENLHQIRTEVKWPNDVLAGGKKIAGILLESVSQGSKIEKVVIGVGLNVNQMMFQGSFSIQPTSLKIEMNDETVDREVLLAELLNTFEENLEKLLKKPENILKEWKARCRMIGERITIVEGDSVKYGIFEDVDDEGFLLLKTKDKTEKIHFGDVSLR